MKKHTRIPFLVAGILFGTFILLAACKKKKDTDPEVVTPPANPLATVSTDSLSKIGYTMATCWGKVSSEGTSVLLAVGVCWDTVPGPTTLRLHTAIGAGTGTFIVPMSGLKSNTTYYVRAYATNGSGTAYGKELSFKTLDTPAPTNTEKLTGKDFKLIAYTSMPAYMGISDFYSTMSACQKDNLWRFEKNATVTEDEGPTKCSPSDQQSIPGSWSWKNNETVLSMTFIGGPTQDYQVLKNDGTTLKLRTAMVENGTSYNMDITFLKQ